MRTEPHPPGGGDPPTAHTEEHITADTETGDSDPEIQVQQPPRRQNLEEAAELVEGEDEEETEEED